MNEAWLISIVFASVTVPIVIFLFVALFSNGEKDATADNATNARSYLLAGGTASDGDFINSSTGYMIQVSTTFYFIYWGYNYGMSNIFYLLSWAAGILLFARFAGALYQSRSSASSIPSLLHDSTARYLKPIAALAAILSFCGVFYVEAYFTADLLSGFSNISGATNSFSPPWWTVFTLIVLVVALYSILGGLKKVIATDVWQLSFAYFGFAVVFSYLLNLSFSVSSVTAYVLSAIVIAIYLAFLIFDRGLNDGRVKRISILASLLLIAGTVILNLASHPQGSTDILISGLFKQIVEPWGWFTLAGFVLLNSLWQFADSSNLQRISALSLDGDPEYEVPRLKKMIRSLAIVSPLTWGLGIILGMLIRAAAIKVGGPGAEYQGLISMLRQSALSGDVLAILVIVSLTAGLVSIMMSTSDSAIVAATQNYLIDIKSMTDFAQRSANMFAFIVVALVFGLALLHSTRNNVSILTIMAGAYSAIIVLAPLTILRLLGWLPNPVASAAAIVLGILAAGVATFGPVSGLPLNVILVLPIFASAGVSILISLIGLPLATRANQSLRF
jgi:Na+/proline symporter